MSDDSEYSKPPATVYGDLGVSLESAVKFMKENYAEAYGKDSLKLTQMVRDLATGDNIKILNWGKSVLHAQSYFVNQASDAIGVYNGLDASKLLGEVVDAAKAKSFFSSFIKRPNKQYYVIQVKSLSLRLENIHRVVSDLLDNVAALNIVDWVATLAAASESATKKENLMYDTLYNRRLLMLQALQNLEATKQQLRYVENMILKMQNEIEHINHVIIPSLNLFGVRK